MKIDLLLPRGPKSPKALKLLYSIMNLNTISLPWQARPTNEPLFSCWILWTLLKPVVKQANFHRVEKKKTNTLVTLLSLRKFWRVFATWRQKNYNATHVNDFCLKKKQIQRILFSPEIIIFRQLVLVGCQNIVGFLKFSTFLSNLQPNLAISSCVPWQVWLHQKICKSKPQVTKT